MARKKLLDMTDDDIIKEIDRNPPNEMRVKKILELYGDNKDVVRKILQSNGKHLYYLSAEFKNDTELVTLAVTEDGMAINHANPRFLKDPAIVKLALHSNPDSLSGADIVFKNDVSYVKIATNRDITSICFASENVRDNYQFMFGLIQRSGRVYNYIGPSLSNHYDLANVAVATYPSAVLYVKPEFFTFELMFNTLTCEEDRFFDIYKRIAIFGEICTANIYLMLEAAQMYRNRGFSDTIPLYTDNSLKKFHPILDWVRAHDFPDTSWPYIRQALLLNPEPFLNDQHVLQQVMNGNNDWGVLADYILYEDALKYGNEQDTTCGLTDFNFSV